MSLEQAVAAPLATRHLADLGARVIKVERCAGGDFARRYDGAVGGESSYFVWLNRSKESVTLDLHRPEARRVLDDLIARADVLVENLGPGSASRLGLNPDALRTRYPRLIYCDISGYGSSGPWATKKAYDMAIQCETGLLALTGTPETKVRTGISIADIAAGMYAYSGILAALYTRNQTGRGTVVEVSLFDALAEWLGSPLYYGMCTGHPPERAGAHHPTIAPYGVFETSDGMVLLAVQNEPEWARFCTAVMNSSDLAEEKRFGTNNDRVSNRRDLDAIIAERLAMIDTRGALEILTEANIACGLVNEVVDLANHPAWTGRNRWRRVETPGGDLPMLLPPASLAGYDVRTAPVPALGEHTEAVLKEIGYHPQIIDRLRSAAAI